MELKEIVTYAKQQFVDERLADYIKDFRNSDDLSEQEKEDAYQFALDNTVIGDIEQESVRAQCYITGKEADCIPLLVVSKEKIEAVDFAKTVNKERVQRDILHKLGQQELTINEEVKPFLGLNIRYLPEKGNAPLLSFQEVSKLHSLYKDNLIFNTSADTADFLHDPARYLSSLRTYEKGVKSQFISFLEKESEILGIKGDEYLAKVQYVPDLSRNGVLIYNTLEIPFCIEEAFRNPILSCKHHDKIEPFTVKLDLGLLSQEDKKIFEAIDLNQISTRFFKNHKDNDLLAGKDFNETETLSAFKQEHNKILKQIADQEVVTLELRNERSLTQLFVHEMEHNILERFIEKEAKVLEEHAKPLNPDDFTLSYREKLDHTNVYNINPNFLTYIEYGETDVLTPEEIEKIENFLKKHEIVGGPATEDLESPSFGRDAITGVKGDIVPVTCINLEAVKDEEKRRLADARIASLSEENQTVFENIFSNHIKSPEFQNNRTLIEPFREKLAEMFEEAQVKGQTLKINVNAEKQKQQEQPKQESKKKDLER